MYARASRSARWFVGASLLMLAVGGCAPYQVRQRIARVAEIDTLICQGETESASKRARVLVDSLAGTPEGAEAAYRLLYLKVFYDQPMPDRGRALEAMRRFAARYPRHPRACEARAWIRLLTNADSLIEHGQARIEELRVLVHRDSVETEKLTGERDALVDSVGTCRAARDSLTMRMQLLEDVIETISRNR